MSWKQIIYLKYSKIANLVSLNHDISYNPFPSILIMCFVIIKQCHVFKHEWGVMLCFVTGRFHTTTPPTSCYDDSLLTLIVFWSFFHLIFNTNQQLFTVSRVKQPHCTILRRGLQYISLYPHPAMHLSGGSSMDLHVNISLGMLQDFRSGLLQCDVTCH